MTAGGVQSRDAHRTVLVVTGSRAEFGLLCPVMRAIAGHPALTLRTLVCGSHLLTDSDRDVRDAGFEIDAEVPMQQPERTGRFADTAALARGVEGIGEALRRLQPDVVLVLGDRIEPFAAASAAAVAGLRIAHVHGGDRAEGIADEAMRHAISKLAHLHFPATAASRRRLIRMGEHPGRVHQVGSPAIDDLREVEPAAEAPEVIVMQHPVGRADAQEAAWMAGTLEATADRARLVMAPNHDPGRAGVMRAIAAAGIEPVAHLPRARWLALLAGCGVLVGNSSAGLIEAAALGKPCVNVGPRQNGREKPANVIDCACGAPHVRRAVAAARQLNLRGMGHPYGRGETGSRIARLLACIDLSEIAPFKRNTF